MIYWILISILALFLILVFVKSLVYKRFKFKICAICSAVSLTWITLLILKTTGFEISNILLGILMGESITGIMYLFEKTAKKEGRRNLLWFKIIIILLGTWLVYLLLTQGFNQSLIVLLVISLVVAVIIYAVLKTKKNDKIKNKKYSRFRNEIAKLEEKFEHCCD